MKRHYSSPTLGLLLAAALFAPNSSPAGEQPGLEVFDAGVPMVSPAPPAVDGLRPPGATYSDPYSDPYAGQTPFIPAPMSQPQYYAPESQPLVSEPYVDPAYVGQPYTDPGYAGQVQSAPEYGDPTFSDQPFVGDPYAEDAAIEAAPVDGEAEAAYTYPQYPAADPRTAALESVNAGNPNFPGIGDAAAQGNLRGVADIVWEVLKQRRVVQATLARGPGASAGTPIPQDYQRVMEAVNFMPPDPTGADSPLRAAVRVNAILDAFDTPIVDDYGFGGSMEQALIRLNGDIFAIRYALGETVNDGDFLELSRTYVRAVTTCDFFAFPRAELVADVNNIMNRAGPMFYQDGASVGGDVAGVTGNLFDLLLRLDFYTRDDSRFRRAIGSTYRTLRQPVRYALDLACPDTSLPRFGPRGSRELGPMELVRLDAVFPKPQSRVQRIGLAASASFPETSNQKSFGGIFATRSGTDANARYCAVRFGPFGTLCSVPGHYDFGSLVLMSRSIKFMVDGGGYGGEAAASGAHSVLSLDGEYALGGTYNEPGKSVDAVWRTNAAIDYATDMAGFADGKTWQRTLLYVKDLPGEARGDYWVVLDHVDMKNDNQPRQARIRYQLAPGIQAYNDGSGVLATASYSYNDASALRIFAIDANAELTVSEGAMGMFPSHIYDAAGGAYAAPAVTLSRTLVGDTTTATLIYPGENVNHRPARIERDADIIRGRTGALVVDHGDGRIDVVAWAPPGTELVTPTLNLQMSADMAVFRIRRGKFARISFVNLERFQAKEPDGGIWSMRVNGPAQTLTLEPEQNGGWQVLSDPANAGGASLYDVNLGPAIARRKFSVRPGEMRIVVR